MKGSDIFFALFIVLVFLGLYFFNVFTVEFANIQNNWPEYRCNPAIMPFSSHFGINPTENFTYCIQNMQKGFMGYLLQPVNHALASFNTLGGEFSHSINMIRHMMSNIRDFVSSITQNIFSVFLNILIQFQRIIISLKDVIAKTIGILTTLLFTLDGTIKTMNSAWRSPAGDVMRSLCFHPDTKIKLQNNKTKKISKLDLGDVLSNGSIICATMQIKNFIGNNRNYPKFWKNDDTNFEEIEQLYSMNQSTKTTPIYVTGSHLVKHNDKWIPVKEHPHAKPIDIKTKWLSCVITDDHLVPIGDYIFHDWEDDNGSPSKDLSDYKRLSQYA